MIPWPRRQRFAAIATTALMLGGVSTAAAQVGPSPIPTQTTPAGEDKPEGPAEAAPDDAAALPTTPMLPPPRAKRKKFELFELDGYFRFRTDWFKNFHLGFDSDPTLGGAPFRIPLSCRSGISTDADPPCEDTLKSANIRLRLEPVINLSETAKVFLRVDVLDNVVLGSTPIGEFFGGTPSPTNIPIKAFADSQVAPEAGRNYVNDSIVVKHAYAQVITALGLLRFGRMPSHWGLGILANSGGYDPFHGTYDLDSDYGDTADRLLWGVPIPGTDLSAAVAMDWASTAPTAAQTDIWANRYDGQPWDLEDADDVNQWIFVISRLDKPQEWQDKVERGELALNYGTYFVYRTQEWDTLTGFDLGSDVPSGALARRGAKAYIPDIWGRLAFKQFSAELEAVAVIGSIEELDDVGVSKPPDADEEDNFDIRQLGAVLKLGYRAMENKLNLGFEVGYASGDQWDNEPQGSTNVRDARALPAGDDLSITNFRFDFDYEIDLILFRELIGTVTNATYLKPSVSYQVTDSINFAAQSIVSFANVPVATPGNGNMYGVEFDAFLGYKGDLGQDQAFFAGLAYGVLFPLGALDHPEELDYGDGNIGNAGTAHTIQTNLTLKF